MNTRHVPSLCSDRDSLVFGAIRSVSPVVLTITIIHNHNTYKDIGQLQQEDAQTCDTRVLKYLSTRYERLNVHVEVAPEICSPPVLVEPREELEGLQSGCCKMAWGDDVARL